MTFDGKENIFVLCQEALDLSLLFYLTSADTILAKEVELPPHCFQANVEGQVRPGSPLGLLRHSGGGR